MTCPGISIASSDFEIFQDCLSRVFDAYFFARVAEAMAIVIVLHVLSCGNIPEHAGAHDLRILLRRSALREVIFRLRAHRFLETLTVGIGERFEFRSVDRHEDNLSTISGWSTLDIFIRGYKLGSMGIQSRSVWVLAKPGTWHHFIVSEIPLKSKRHIGSETRVAYQTCYSGNPTPTTPSLWEHAKRIAGKHLAPHEVNALGNLELRADGSVGPTQAWLDAHP